MKSVQFLFLPDAPLWTERNDQCDVGILDRKSPWKMEVTDESLFLTGLDFLGCKGNNRESGSVIPWSYNFHVAVKRHNSFYSAEYFHILEVE